MWEQEEARQLAEARAAAEELGPLDRSVDAVVSRLRGDRSHEALAHAKLFAGWDPECPTDRAIGELRPGPQYVIALALARHSLSQPADAARVAAACRLLWRGERWCYGEFVSEFVRGMNTLAGPERDAWLQALEHAPTFEPHSVPQGRVTVRQESAARQLTDPFEVWSDRSRRYADIDGYAPLDILWDIAPERWLLALEGWNEPSLVAAAILGDPTITQDRELLAAMIADAPICFDAEEKWTGNVAALLLLKLVEAHGIGLLQEIGMQQHEPSVQHEVLNKELCSFFRACWDVLLQRPDGTVLAAAMHAEMAWNILYRSHGGLGPDVAVVCWEALGQAMASVGMSSQRLAELAQRRAIRPSPDAKCAALWYSALGVAAAGGPSGAELAQLCLGIIADTPRAAESLRSRGKLIPLLNQTLEHLDKLPDAAERTARAYSDLAYVRRRAEQAADYESIARNNASAVLLLLRAVLARKPRTAGDPSIVLEEASRLLLTMPTGPHVDFSYVELAVGEALSSCAMHDPEALARALPPILSDPRQAVRVLAPLLKQPTRAAILGGLAACNTSLRAVVDDAAEWAQALEDESCGAALERIREVLEEMASS